MRSLHRAVLAAAALMSFAVSPISGARAQECAFQPWRNYDGVTLQRMADGAYMFRLKDLEVTAVGAPRAFHPAGQGLDDAVRAGWRGPGQAGWEKILVADPVDPAQPFIQTRGAGKGYFLSRTRLQAEDRALTDPRRYVDAAKVPYVVFPRAFYELKGTGLFGDLGVAWSAQTGKLTGFIVADEDTAGRALGEVSIALAEALGAADPDPRGGRAGNIGEITFVVFPYSARERPRVWPMQPAEVGELGVKSLELFGGKELVDSCR